MKKFLMLLVPYAAWAQVVFVLFDAGERVALTPVAETLKEQGKEVRIIDIDPKGRDRYASFDGEWDGLDPDVLVVGDASVTQLEFVRKFGKSAKTICYYDNPLEIDRIPYSDLIRIFEKEVDLFLVSSERAALSSTATHLKVVGNPDLDLFEAEVEKIEVIPGQKTYFGGYDSDYREAFQAFLEFAQEVGGEFIVRPHPTTNGELERSLIAESGMDYVRVAEDGLSSIEAIGQSESVIIHRSSIGTKAAIAGKRVIAIESDGTIQALDVSRESLGIPKDSLQKILAEF